MNNMGTDHSLSIHHIFPYTKVSKLNCNQITDITYVNSDAVTGRIDRTCKLSNRGKIYK